MDPGQYDVVFELEEIYWWHVGLRELVLGCLSQYGAPAPRALILDAGCGSGMLLAVLREQGYTHTIGLDAASQAIALACRRGLSALVRGSVDALPFADAQFDAVTCLDVLYHRMVADDVAAMREVGRVMKPGGILVAHLPSYEWLRGPHDAVAHTRHRYRAGEVRRKLEEAGFHVLRLTYRNSLLFPLALVRRLLVRLNGDRAARSDLAPLSPRLNGVFTWVLRLENRLLRRITFPCGLSVFCVARKGA